MMKPQTPPPDLDLNDPDTLAMAIEIVVEEMLLQDYDAALELLIRLRDEPTKH